MGLADTLMQNIGNIEKAKIEILDLRMREPGRQPSVKVEGGRPVGFVAMPELDMAQTAFGKTGMNSLLEKNVSGIVQKNIARFGGKIRGMTKKVFTVQFNPSSLKIRARGPGYMPLMGFGTSQKATDTTSQNVRITIGVQLIFDQVHPFDAFMEDKTNMAPSALGVNIAKGIMTAKGKKPVTVQKTVEGFLAAVRNRNTRIITFIWGNLRYAGFLNQVAAQYTMFNLQGQPIRATVNLEILSVQDDLVPNSLGPWEAAYKRVFEGDAFDTVRSTQQFGNLVNLG